jgi:tRNA A-37 threonylcarbamoyl transferase component Bud32
MRTRKRQVDMRTQRLGQQAWIIRDEKMDPLLRQLLEDPDVSICRYGEVLKSTGTVTIWRNDQVVIKRWCPATIGALIKNLFRASYARRAFQKACLLEAAGILTAHPIASSDRRTWGVLTASYFVMESVGGAIDLGSCRGYSSQAIGEVARLLGRLHSTGFTHRDLKPSNILFDRAGRAYLIDLEGIRVKGQVRKEQAVADLAKLARRMIELAALSPSEATAFLRQYCHSRGERNRRWWWWQIRGGIAHYLPELAPRLRDIRITSRRIPRPLS